MREFVVKDVIAIPRRADITIAANDDVGIVRIVGAIGSIGYGTMESTVNTRIVSECAEVVKGRTKTYKVT
jgi:hypothetical protein